MQLRGFYGTSKTHRTTVFCEYYFRIALQLWWRAWCRHDCIHFHVTTDEHIHDGRHFSRTDDISDISDISDTNGTNDSNQLRYTADDHHIHCACHDAAPGDHACSITLGTKRQDFDLEKGLRLHNPGSFDRSGQ
jgi:hypothetical protein